ncbi:MAG: cytochrome c family protein [Hyphomicrobiales bacterium]|nr:cytochrome c family protein [Hyphomicrobiales bacterium]
MDSFEFNKIAGAVLGTLLFVMAVSVVSGGLFTPAKPAIPGYDLPSAEPETGAGAPKAEPALPLPELLAKADPAAGQKDATICSTCHSFGKGEPSKATGPNLWGVLGRVHAADKDFDYSQANRDLGAKGEKWTYDAIFNFIKAPRDFMPGTKMTFAGMSKAEDRANVVAYLRTLSDNPEPLPAVTAQAQPAGGQAAPAQGAQPGAQVAQPTQGEKAPAEKAPAEKAPAEAPKQ